MTNSVDLTTARRDEQPADDEKKDVLRRARAKIAEMRGLQQAPDALQDRILSELGVDDHDADSPDADANRA